MTASSPTAEYIVGCRGCGNHCVVVERDRAVPVEGETVYSDGYIGGWQGIQTEVVTCPTCGLVMSWRKNCQSAALLRQAGDLSRFRILQAVWGPAALYWVGFDQYDAEFHQPTAGPAGDILPRLQQAPEAGSLWALRKRAALARGLLWLDNDRDRTEFAFGGMAPEPKRTRDEERKRARLLRALIEAAQFGGDPSEHNALELAEWQRELGDWKAATNALGGDFSSPVAAARARQQRAWVAARQATVMRFETVAEPVATPAPRPAPPPPPPPPPPSPSPPPAPSPAPPPPAAAKPAKAKRADTKSPRMLLATLLEVLGTLPAETLTRDYIPRPYGALIRGVMKSHSWDEDSFAVSLIRGFAKQHGWPDDVDQAALDELLSFSVDDEELADYLAACFKKATWEDWAFEVPKIAAPKRGK